MNYYSNGQLKQLISCLNDKKSFNYKLNERTKQLEIIRNKYKLDENDNLISPNPCFFILKPNVIGQKMNIYKLNPGEII